MVPVGRGREAREGGGELCMESHSSLYREGRIEAWPLYQVADDKGRERHKVRGSLTSW